MEKKEYKTPRSKVIFLNFRDTFLGNSAEGIGIVDDEDASAKRAYGRFASWEDDED